MAKRYKFEKAYTHIVRDSKSGLVTGHVHYPEGHEGLIKEEHAEGAEAARAGSVVAGPSSDGARDANAQGGSRDAH
jgi:hypothetical protein